VGTPFHDGAGVKGVGCDCLHLAVRVAAVAGIIQDFDPEYYSPQWFQHRAEPRFLNGIAKYCKRVEVAEPGDFEMFNFGYHAAHLAIVIDDHSIVHAYKPAARVCLDGRAQYAPRFHSAWSPYK
jgi:cell wall-associated NlpC family hydrolase